MADNLDKWIKDSKATTPDSGEFRRLNRILLKDKMASVVPARRRRFRWVLALVTLALLLLVSGQVTKLGSDGFDTQKTVEYRPTVNDSITIYKNVFRGESVTLPHDFSEADVDEFQRSLAAGDGTVAKATGLSYGGQTVWLKFVTLNINGQDITAGKATENPPSQDPENYLQFLQDNYRDLMARIKNDPPHATEQRTLDGILFEFDIWTYEYPGYGPVTRYIGYPVS